MTGARDPADIWADAVMAAMIFALDPIGTGVSARARHGPARDKWLALVSRLLPADRLMRKLPLNIADERLLGGLDLAATLTTGQPVFSRGLLAEADGGVLLIPMAERLSASTAAHLAAVLDTGEIMIERDSMSLRPPARFGIIACDEGIDDERMPNAILDRIGSCVDLDGLAASDCDDIDADRDVMARAQTRLLTIAIGDDVLHGLCATALALGIGSQRAPMQAIRVARAAAALTGQDSVGQAEAELAARLVLAPRATVMPSQNDEPDSSQQDQPNDPSTENEALQPETLDDIVLAAAQAAIPADLLKQLQAGAPRQSSSGGRAGAAKISRRRGRPIGVRRGDLAAGARLNVLATLRAAAPWQRLRAASSEGQAPNRIAVRKDDFRITRFKQHTETATIFVVDASGSAALQRLAEVKGAVELMLADCYIRRDEVALIAFRGKTAELILPPTRSLARAKRCLSSLPGGGGTPLSLAIESATALALAVRSKGKSPTIVLMTDGKANVGRDGSPGRTEAEAEALAAARQLRVASVPAVLVDTSPRPQAQAEKLAREMDARYVGLPYANAATLNRAVQAVM